VGVELGGTKPKGEPSSLGEEPSLLFIDDGLGDFLAGIGHVSKLGHWVEVAVEIRTCDTAVWTGIGHDYSSCILAYWLIIYKKFYVLLSHPDPSGLPINQEVGGGDGGGWGNGSGWGKGEGYGNGLGNGKGSVQDETDSSWISVITATVIPVELRL
jgi:hypothetical protein